MRHAYVRPLVAFATLAAACSGAGLGPAGPDGSVVPDLADRFGPPVVLETEAFEVGAGKEAYRCQNFKNPFGEDAEIARWESHMAPGSHHMLAFLEAGLGDKALESCSGFEFGNMIYGAQQPDSEVSYPDGIAAFVRGDQGIRVAMHYLNASPQPITARVRLLLYRAKAGTVQNRAAVFFFNNVAILIPPGAQPYTLKKSCTLKQDMNLLYSVGHMHQRAKNLTATVGGQVIYSTDDWAESAFTRHDPPLALKVGDKIEFSCTWVNDTGGLLTFGESAQTNEMCIFDGQFFPSADGKVVDCP